MTRTKAPRRYVVWRATDDGRWYPAATLPRDEALALQERLEHDGEAYYMAPAPEFDPDED
ncbi:MAG: hypothetical protein K6W08_05985 [Firmicutes bacterium]|nr:hypothetical protein [Bacillota bacterium]